MNRQRVNSFPGLESAEEDRSMKVRVGVDLSVDEGLLQGWGREVQFVRIPEDPKEEIEIDFWVAALPPRIVRRQWQWLRSVL
jgi:hypothetical protein